MSLRLVSTWRFQSTPPSRGATRRLNADMMEETGFQSTPPSRGATEVRDWLGLEPKISIHAPLAGGDALVCQVLVPWPISIHAPLAGGDGAASSGK